MNNAFDSVRNSYDIETLREIRDHGCASGVAHDHIYYSDTLTFFDHFEDEIIEYIADILGGEFNEELWNNNPCNWIGYKNDTVWCFIELVASCLVDEYEDTTQEELSDSDEIDFDFSSKGDTLTAKPLNATTYDAVKELASTPWGQDHLQIISA
tara:strand:- start:469 stop:930 length:462 start_codon:yes stop_codon:yes gene_type:complete